MKYFKEFSKVKEMKKKDVITMLVVMAGMLVLYFAFGELSMHSQEMSACYPNI